jgi:hypothetical protein
MSMEPHVLPDMSCIDSPAEELAELLGLDLMTAQRVWDWSQDRQRLAVLRERASLLGSIVGKLTEPTRNLRARVWALALAVGLDELNGTHSQAEVAGKLGCTRALISHYVTAWADLLQIDVRKFRRSPEARKAYKESASRAWRRRKRL